MGFSPSIWLAAVLLLLVAAGTWVFRQRPGQAETPVAVVLPAGQNHSTVGQYNYLLSDYLDVESQLRDRHRAEQHALKVDRLRNHERLTQHQAELATEQARDQAAWEENKEAIAQWLAGQRQVDATLNPPAPPPPVDFKDASLSPAKRRQAMFQQLTAAAEAVVA